MSDIITSKKVFCFKLGRRQPKSPFFRCMPDGYCNL